MYAKIAGKENGGGNINFKFKLGMPNNKDGKAVLHNWTFACRARREMGREALKKLTILAALQKRSRGAEIQKYSRACEPG